MNTRISLLLLVPIGSSRLISQGHHIVRLEAPVQATAAMVSPQCLAKKVDKHDCIHDMPI